MSRFEKAIEALNWHKAIRDFEDRLSSIVIRLDLIEEQVDKIEGVEKCQNQRKSQN